MNVRELIEMLSEYDPETNVSVSVDTGRSYRCGEMVGISFDGDSVFLCGEEPEDFCE